MTYRTAAGDHDGKRRAGSGALDAGHGWPGPDRSAPGCLPDDRGRAVSAGMTTM